MKVLESKVLVRLVTGDEAKIKLGNIELLENTGQQRAVAVSVGEDAATKGISPGDELIIYPGCGAEVMDPSSGEKLRVIVISEILAILNK